MDAIKTVTIYSWKLFY